MKIVLTGATGFIGQHVLPLLHGHEVCIISRKEKPGDWKFGGSWIKGSVSEKEKIQKAFTGADVLINLAAEIKDENLFHQTNIIGTNNLLELCKENGVKRIIHLSSVGVVGMQYSAKDIVVDESTPCNPKNGYEKTKYESEKRIEAAANENMHVVILRPTNVFGDNHPRQALLGFLKNIQQKKQMACTKAAKVNYVYVGDLANTIAYFVANKEAAPGIYNVGYSLDFSYFYELACKLMDSEPRLRILGKTLPGFLSAVGFFGISKIKRAAQAVSNQVMYSDEKLQQLQKHKFGVEKGLMHTIEWYKKKGVLDA